jgi:hypothetical protein
MKISAESGPVRYNDGTKAKAELQEEGKGSGDMTIGSSGDLYIA